MKLTKGQLKDLETIRYFIPSNYDGFGVYEKYTLIELGHWRWIVEPTRNKPRGKIIEIYEDVGGLTPEEAYLQISERGIKEIKCSNPKNLMRLLWGKVYRGRHTEMYEEGILDGSMLYWVILGGYSPKEIPPRSVVDFMKKEMFKGIDSDLIEKTYQRVLKEWNWYGIIKYWIYWNIIFKIKMFFRLKGRIINLT